MYARVERRLRPQLLKEVRRQARAAAAAPIGSEPVRGFVLDMEMVLLAFMDGDHASFKLQQRRGEGAAEAAEATPAGGDAGGEDEAAAAAACMGAPFQLGHEAAGALNAPMRVLSLAQRAGGGVPTLELRLADGFYRVLATGLAQFYGLAAADFRDSAAPDHRGLHVWLRTPGPAAEAQALRQRIAADSPAPQSAGAAAGQAADEARVPLVPLFTLHARAITADEGGAVPGGGSGAGPAGEAAAPDPAAAIAAAAAAAAMAHLRATSVIRPGGAGAAGRALPRHPAAASLGAPIH
jgi:hypothetical protein